MSLGLVGRKIGMTRVFTEDGSSLPVTVLEVSNNRVTQVKSVDTDGYTAVQVAHGVRRPGRLTRQPGAGACGLLPIARAASLGGNRPEAPKSEHHWKVLCLDLATGRLLWRFQGAPTAEKVLGNGRLISQWPARGGPVVHQGTVYFAAGIWPFMGVFYEVFTDSASDVAGARRGASRHGGAEPDGHRQEPSRIGRNPDRAGHTGIRGGVARGFVPLAGESGRQCLDANGRSAPTVLGDCGEPVRPGHPVDGG